MRLESFHPLLVRQPFARRKPYMPVKERLRAAGVRLSGQLHGGKGRHRVAAETVQAARLDQLGDFPRLAGHQIPGEFRAFGPDFTLRYHG